MTTNISYSSSLENLFENVDIPFSVTAQLDMTLPLNFCNISGPITLDVVIYLQNVLEQLPEKQISINMISEANIVGYSDLALGRMLAKHCPNVSFLVNNENLFEGFQEPQELKIEEHPTDAVNFLPTITLSSGTLRNISSETLTVTGSTTQLTASFSIENIIVENGANLTLYGEGSIGKVIVKNGSSLTLNDESGTGMITTTAGGRLTFVVATESVLAQICAGDMPFQYTEESKLTLEIQVASFNIYDLTKLLDHYPQTEIILCAMGGEADAYPNTDL